jgi:hypothetical protein
MLSGSLRTVSLKRQLRQPWRLERILALPIPSAATFRSGRNEFSWLPTHTGHGSSCAPRSAAAGDGPEGLVCNGFGARGGCESPDGECRDFRKSRSGENARTGGGGACSGAGAACHRLVGARRSRWACLMRRRGERLTSCYAALSRCTSVCRRGRARCTSGGNPCAEGCVGGVRRHRTADPDHSHSWNDTPGISGLCDVRPNTAALTSLARSIVTVCEVRRFEAVWVCGWISGNVCSISWYSGIVHQSTRAVTGERGESGRRRSRRLSSSDVRPSRIECRARVPLPRCRS